MKGNVKQLFSGEQVARAFYAQGENRHVIMLIGVPGSGKSALALKFPQFGYAVLNKDSIRRELYGCESNQGRFGEVDRLFQGRLNDCLQLGLNVVIDNCNVHMSERRKVIDAALRHNYACHLVLLEVPLSIAKARNAARQRQVPEQVIENFYSELCPQTDAPLSGKGYPKPDEGSLMVIEPELSGYYSLISMRA